MSDTHQNGAVLDLREHPEGSTRVERRLSAEAIGLSSEETTVVDPMELVIDVVRTGNSFELRGRLRGRAVESCSRCAESFERTFEETFLFYASPALADETAEAPEDDDFISHDRRSIDLNDRIRDLVLTSAPMAPVCHAECRGLCPICGGNLNKTSCECERSEPDPRWQVIRDHLDKTRSGGS